MRSRLPGPAAPSDLDLALDLARRFRAANTIRGNGTARDILGLYLHDPRLTDDGLEEIWLLCRAAGGTGDIDREALLRTRVARLDSAAAHYDLGNFLASDGRPSDGLPHLKTALARAPDLYPDVADQIAAAERALRGARPPRRLPRYPDARALAGNLRRLIADDLAADLNDAPKFIGPATRFFTMGSCFADNVARALRTHDFQVDILPIAEAVNSPAANRRLVDWIDGRATPQFAERIGNLIPAGVTPDTLRAAIAACDVFILTLGVAPSYRDEAGEFVLPTPGAARHFRFVTPSVSEALDDVRHVLEFVRRINPGSTIVVTESPVPIMASFEFRSAVVADCLSKSVLRVAAHQAVHHSGIERVYYWPSFEAVRWVGCHTGPVYGVDDGESVHVSEAVVAEIVGAFLDVFSG